MKEKSRATVEEVFNIRVMTGNATAPPPSAVAPPMKDPKIMVMVIG